MTIDVCSHYEGSHFDFLQAVRRFWPFYEVQEHFLEDRMTTSVAKQYKLTSSFDVLWEICFISTNKAEPNSKRSRG